MSDADEFFANLSTDGEKPFGEDEVQPQEDESADSQSEKDDVGSPSQEGDEDIVEETNKEDDVSKTKPDNTLDDSTPFHQHPRFKELIQERNELREKLNEVGNTSSQIEELKTQISQLNSVIPQTQSIPDWFVELYGDNHDAWSKYEQHTKAEKEQMVKEIRAEIQREQKQQEEQSQQWNKWVDSQLSSLEDEGKSFDRNELMKITLEYKPTDDSGNIDFRKAFELLQKLKPAKTLSPERKKIASITGNNGGEPSSDRIISSDDIRNKDWQDLIQA